MSDLSDTVISVMQLSIDIDTDVDIDIDIHTVQRPVFHIWCDVRRMALHVIIWILLLT